MGLSVEKTFLKENHLERNASQPSPYTLEAAPGRILRILLIITGILVVLNVLAILTWFVGGYDQALGFVPGFYMDKEANVPTFFSSLILLLAGFLFGVIARYKKTHKESYVFHWALLSGVFLYMALDEVASFHEHLILPLRSSLNLSGIFYYSWVIVGIVFLVGFAAYYLKFFFSLTPRFRAGFFLAAFVYVSGALGMELIGGYYAEQHGLESLTYAFITTVEETLELVGILILIKHLFLYLQKHTRLSGLRLSLKNE